MSVTSQTTPAKAWLWLMGARPQTLLLALSPMIVGVSYGYASTGRVAWLPVLMAALSALCIQIATNIANDAADGARGGDGASRLGPLRITGSGLMSAAEMYRGALIATLLAAAFGAIAALYGGLPIMLIGVASLAAAWAYSYGPWPIARTPFGEVFVLAFFGVAATLGMSWLASHVADVTALLLGIAIGLPACAVLLTNNHRDRSEDERNGRRTLALVLGDGATRRLYAAFLGGALLIAALALSFNGALLMLVLVPPAWLLARHFIAMPISAALNGSLKATALFQLACALCIAIALVALP